MTNRDTLLLTEAAKLLPQGASIEAEIAKFPGPTRTLKLIQFLEANNEERRTGISLRGFYTGSFTSKKELLWRMIGENKQAIVIATKGIAIPEPIFGQKINFTGLDLIYHKVSGRSEYSLSYQSKVENIPGTITDIVTDLTTAEEGYGLYYGSLFRVDLMKDKDKRPKPIIGEDRVNFKITIKGPSVDGPGKGRFVSGFINSIQDIIALAPEAEGAYIRQAIESGRDQEVVDALQAHSYNKDLSQEGVGLIVYGRLTTNPGTDGKTYWNLGIYNILTVDNYEARMIRQQMISPQQAQTAPMPTYQTPAIYAPPQPQAPQIQTSPAGMSYTPPTAYIPPQPQPQPQQWTTPSGTPYIQEPPQPQTPYFQPIDLSAITPTAVAPISAPATTAAPTYQPQAPAVAAPQAPWNMMVTSQVRKGVYDLIKANPSVRAMDIMTTVMQAQKCERSDVVDAMNWLVMQGYVANKDRTTYMILKMLEA